MAPGFLGPRLSRTQTLVTRLHVFKEHHAGLNAGGLQQILRVLHIRRASWHWWSQSGSNRRPPACKAGALPAELWPQACYNLKPMVGLGGLEPPASPLSGVRSNHLSYRPMKLVVKTTKHALRSLDRSVWMCRCLVWTSCGSGAAFLERR